MSEDKESNVEERLTEEEFYEKLKNSSIDPEKKKAMVDQMNMTNKIVKGAEEVFQNLKKENSELKEKWQRSLADYQNLERRTQTEISQRVSEKINNLLLNFINIYEDFIRAENSLSKEKINTDGIQAVIKNMENLLSENNIKPIDAVGEIFDPQIHEAVSMVEDDSLDDGTITQEVSKGYISGKAILKPSKVIVSKKKN